MKRFLTALGLTAICISFPIAVVSYIHFAIQYGPLAIVVPLVLGMFVFFYIVSG